MCALCTRLNAERDQMLQLLIRLPIILKSSLESVLASDVEDASFGAGSEKVSCYLIKCKLFI